MQSNMSLETMSSPTAPSAPKFIGETARSAVDASAMNGTHNGIETSKPTPPSIPAPTSEIQAVPDPALQQPPGKLRSWRKKYRKLKVRFDGSMGESNKLFKEEKNHLSRCRRIQEDIEYVFLKAFTK
jgi:hypothetical protein